MAELTTLGEAVAERVHDRDAVALEGFTHLIPFAAGHEVLRQGRVDLVAIVHAQEADRAGNVQLWGIRGVQKEAVLAARRSLVTVERIVEQLEPRPGGVIIPAWTIDVVAAAPGGSRPSYS